MPKKNSSWGSNPKAVESRERKAAQKNAERDREQRAKEDALWADNDKKLAKKQQRKDNESQKRQDELKRKAEAKELLEAEEAKLGPGKAASGKSQSKKVTRAELDQAKQKERDIQKQQAEKAKLEKARIVEAPEIECENPNRKMAEMIESEGIIEARGVSEAIAVLSVDEAASSADRHPEKRMKAAYTDFEARRLPELKAENPNLRLSQLKQMLRKEWLKCPDNPMNQR